jgi:hypothetical protein
MLMFIIANLKTNQHKLPVILRFEVCKTLPYIHTTTTSFFSSWGEPLGIPNFSFPPPHAFTHILIQYVNKGLKEQKTTTTKRTYYIQKRAKRLESSSCISRFPVAYSSSGALLFEAPSSPSSTSGLSLNHHNLLMHKTSFSTIFCGCLLQLLEGVVLCNQ